MAADNAGSRQFVAGQGVAIRGEAAGEGTPIVLCHGLTATRRSVVHGSRALERSGFRVVTYDARGHGESDPAPRGGGYGYPELIGDLDRVVAEEVGGARRFLLGGHSMGAHTALGYALRHPESLAGLVLAGPTYGGPLDADSVAYWEGLAAALRSGGVEAFVAYVGAEQPIDPRWRDSVLRFTRERMLRHRNLDAVAEALRQVPHSQPFGGLRDLSTLDVPALVVASHDEADPGHPYATAAAYAEVLPRGELVSEPQGASPLGWQGGRLSRAIAAFYASLREVD